MVIVESRFVMLFRISSLYQVTKLDGNRGTDVVWEKISVSFLTHSVCDAL